MVATAEVAAGTAPRHATGLGACTRCLRRHRWSVCATRRPAASLQAGLCQQRCKSAPSAVLCLAAGLGHGSSQCPAGVPIASSAHAIVQCFKHDARPLTPFTVQRRAPSYATHVWHSPLRGRPQLHHQRAGMFLRCICARVCSATHVACLAKQCACMMKAMPSWTACSVKPDLSSCAFRPGLFDTPALDADSLLAVPAKVC